MPLWLVFLVIAEGLVVAAASQSVWPQVTVSETVLLGVVGAFLAGLIGWLFINAPFGVFFALAGALALVYTRARFIRYA